MQDTQTIPTLILMSAREARERTAYVREGFEDRRDVLVEIFERRGWKALKYATWKEYFMVEIQPSMPSAKFVSDKYMYKLAAAKRNKERFSPIGEIPYSEAILREVERLPSDEMKREVLRHALEHYNGTMTATIRVVFLWVVEWLTVGEHKHILMDSHRSKIGMLKIATLLFLPYPFMTKLL